MVDNAWIFLRVVRVMMQIYRYTLGVIICGVLMRWWRRAIFYWI
jgi:hypothetical protein